MSSKRILIVTQHFYPENFKVNDLALGLSELGYEVDVLCGHPNYPDGNWYKGYDGKHPTIEEYHDITIYRSKEIPRKGNTSIRIFLNYISWPFFASLKARSLKKTYEAVFCYNTSPVLMIAPAAVAAKRSNCPLVTYVLDLWPENFYSVMPIRNRLLRAILWKISNRLYARSDVLIAVSDPMQKRLEARMDPSSRLYASIPQHAESFYEDPISDEELSSLYEGKRVLVFAGNLSPAQNLEMVIKAVIKVHEFCKDVYLLIVGSGMSEGDLRKIVDDNDAHDYIEFVGRVNAKDVPKYTSIASALILSLSASQDLSLTIPAKLASYMAAGKPILASVDGAPAEIICEAKCGLVAEPNNVEAFVRCISEFIATDRSESERMSSNSKEYFLRNFTRSICLDRIDEVIDKLT